MPLPPRAPPPSPAVPPGPVLDRAKARLVWLGMAVMGIGAVIGALAAASATPSGPTTGLGDLFLGVASLVVVGDLAVGFFVTSRIRKNAAPSAPPDGIAATQVIVGAATALSGLFVTAVFFFIAREGLILLLAVPAGAVLLSWFPSERRWTALRPAAAPGQGRPSMMRE